MPTSTDRPKRIRRDSPEARGELRQRIVHAALATFRQHGEQAVTMRGIAQQVGVSQMALYGYFTDKSHLLRSTWEFLFSELHEQILRAIGNKRSGRARLTALFESWLNYWEENPRNYRLVYLTGHEVPHQEYREHFKDVKVYQQLYELFMATITEFAVEASLPTVRVQLATDVMVCQGIGYLHATLTVGRYPWSSKEGLRRATLENALLCIAQTLSSRWPLLNGKAGPALS
jgi:AcrR family transcriptional regulator